MDLKPKDEIRADPNAKALQDRMKFDPTMSLDAVERAHILHVLDAVGGDKVRAAQILEVNLSTVYRKLARYQVEGHVA